MKEEIIFDLWLSGYSLSDIAQKIYKSENEVKRELIDYVKDLKIEEDASYKNIWQKYNFSKVQFIDIFNEAELIYNYLNLIYQKGSKHPIFLLFDKKFEKKMFKYLDNSKFPTLSENENVSEEIKTKFRNQEAISEKEFLDIGFIYEDKFVFYYTQFDLSREEFCKIFRVTRQGYSYLEYRFIKGTADFSLFAKQNTHNTYAQRYKLSESITKIHELKEITTKIKNNDEIKSEDFFTSSNKLLKKANKVQPKSEKKVDNLETLYNDIFEDKKKSKSEVLHSFKVKTMQNTQNKRKNNIKVEIFYPSFVNIFKDYEVRDFEYNLENSKKTEVKIDYWAINSIAKSHKENKSNQDNKIKFVSSISNYQNLIKNVKPRFDVKKKSKSS